MSRGRARANRRSTAPGEKPSTNRQPARSRKKSLRIYIRKHKAWTASFTTVVLAGALSGVLATQAGRVMPPPQSPSMGSAQPTREAASTAVPLVTPKTPPLHVLSENPIELQELGVWSFPGFFVLPKNAPNVNDTAAVVQYMKAHGGYPASSVTQLVVQNTRNYPIRILDMQVVKNCQQPLTGTLFYNPPQGADLSIEVGFDLDSTDPEAKLTRGPGITASLPDYFSRYTVSISPGAQEVFDIRSVTTKYSCTFRYEVTVLDGQHEVQQLIGDGNQPFRISAVVGTSATIPFAKYRLVYIGDDPQVPGSYNKYEKVNGKTFTY
jgi:hypothetical protein